MERVGASRPSSWPATQQSFDYLGISVAISGRTIVAGADLDDLEAQDAGSAYVFVQSGATWLQQAKLTASDAGTSDSFGNSVAISGDTAVIGALGDDYLPSGPLNAGAAYVFVRGGASWDEQAELVASDLEPQKVFGRAVAIDGSTILVGADGEDLTNASSAGSAYVFVQEGATWTEQAKLVAGDAEAYDYFGYSVALSGDLAVIGAAGDDDPSLFETGSADVFVRSGTEWIEQTKFFPSSSFPEPVRHFHGPFWRPGRGR